MGKFHLFLLLALRFRVVSYLIHNLVNILRMSYVMHAKGALLNEVIDRYSNI